MAVRLRQEDIVEAAIAFVANLDIKPYIGHRTKGLNAAGRQKAIEYAEKLRMTSNQENLFLSVADQAIVARVNRDYARIQVKGASVGAA